MKKLAVVVGHNSRSQGAVRPDTGESEYVYNGKIAAYMEKIGREYGLNVKVFFREPGVGYRKEIQNVYRDVDKWGAEGAVELHFNASGNPSASGTETLTSGSAGSVAMAEAVQMELVEELGLRDRGIKVRNSRTKGRGYQSLVAGKCPAILTEPFFATSTKGQQASDSKLERQKIGEVILQGIANAWE